MSRLPVPGSDSGEWGSILNDYLAVAHTSNGALRAEAVSNSGGVVATNNLSDLQDIPAARSNLGLGSSATRNVGTIVGTVAAGDDSRITGAIQSGIATTKGDLIVATAASILTRLGVGSDGQILMADSTQTAGIKWAAVPSAPVSSVAGKTGAVTLVEGDIANLTSDLAATERTANKGAASGYAPLDSGSKLPAANLPTTIPTGNLGSGTADSSHYLRGDQTWATLPSAPVSSIFGRTGTITAQSGDYTAAQVGALPATDDLSAIAAANATAGNVSMNSHKITGLANGTASSDAAAFGQIPASLPPSGSASGDLSGNYPSPSVAKINGVSVSGTPTSGQVLAATSSSAATWSTLAGTNDWINVKTQYGATGNGTTDDTTALQNAIAAAAGGGVVYLPAGTYLLNSSSGLTLSVVGTKLIGAGTAASIIKIGASFSAAQAVAITADSCAVSGLSIVGASSTVTSNPICNGIEITGSQHVKVHDIFAQYINGWAIESAGSASRGNLDSMFRSIIGRNCAGGMHFLGVSGSSFQGEQFATDIQLQNIGAASGANANLDAYLIEDCQDIVTQGINAAVAGGSQTGSTIHIKGACSSCYFTNIDVGMITRGTASPTILVESSANGSPNCAFDNGVVQAGNYGISVTAGTDIVFGRLQIKLNNLHGASLTGGTRVYMQGCSFSSNNQSGGTAYEIYAALSTFGFVENCIAASPVGSGAGSVTNPIDDTTQKLYVFNTAFVGSGSTPSLVFASGGTPQIVRSCPGYNPRGSITAPTIGASPYTVSTSQNDVTIVFTAINGMTAFKIGGTSVGLPATGAAYHIPARVTVEVDWATTAPTWIWIAD